MKRFALGVLTGILLTVAAAWLALNFVASPAHASTSQGIWADACIYNVTDISGLVNYPYGSVKYIQGVALNADGRFLPDDWARNAVAAFDCARYHF